MHLPSSLDEYRKLVGARIRQAREMAGLHSLADLTSKIPGWSPSRLHNYEKGVSLPNPLDIAQIARVTETNPCWITYGAGSIRAQNRDIQAIRHQNFKYVVDVLLLSSTEAAAFRKATGLKPRDVKTYANDPTAKLTATICRKTEKHLEKPKGWMDEQHVETDGACEYFPEEIRELLSLYSDMDADNRAKFLEIAKILC